MAFELGQAVQLKGGGPIMTVTGFTTDSQGKRNVTCTWFDKTDAERTATYPPEALKAYVGEVGSTDADRD